VKSAQSYTLTQLASLCGAEVMGDGNTLITGMNSIEQAGAGDITFLSNPARYREALKTLSAGAIILAPQQAERVSIPRLVSVNPYACYARVATALFPQQRPAPGVHATAVVHATARLGVDVYIGPHVTVEAGAELGDGVVLEAGSVVGRGVRLGKDSHLHPRVVVYDHCELGQRVILHSGVVIGADGFGMAPDQGKWLKIPQVGRVILGDDVEVGANTTIDRGAIDDTVIEDGVKMDNLIQIGHNCHIGAHTVIAGCVGISGSTRVGRGCRIGGASGIAGHITIGDGVTIMGFSMVTKSVADNETIGSGFPAQRQREWLALAARLQAVPEWMDRVSALEKELNALGRK
jgi:UDP-3-O-[3-hydroxymyristoyl] glucosamine N-acyltransferase